MKHISRIPKWVKIVIGIITGIVVVVGVIGGVMYMNHEREKQYMVSVIKHSEVQNLIVGKLKSMDKEALTDKGKIKSYTVDYTSVKHNPMGGIGATVVVNNDKDMRIGFWFDKINDQIEIGSTTTDPKLYELVGYKNDN